MNQSTLARFHSRRIRLVLCLSLCVLALGMLDETAHAATFTTFDVPGAVQTIPWSINTAGAITGYYQDASNAYHGFLRDPGGSLTTFNVPGALQTVPVSINTTGAIAGYYQDASYVYRGFLRDPGGSLTSFDVPGGLNRAWNGALPQSINTAGVITGYYLDASGGGAIRGFLRDSGGTFTTFDPPGGHYTVPQSINTLGAITGSYLDASEAQHAFLRDSGGTCTTFDDPGAFQTFPWNINPAGAITGYYQDASGAFRGFIFVAGTAPHYSVCLLYDPTKAVHSGATIPIKLQLCDGSGNDLSSSSIIVHAISITQTSTSISGPVQDSGNSNPDNDFRFDSGLGSTGGYIFNLKTTGVTTGTYSLNFTVTGDSFVYTAPFQVK